MEIQLQNIGKRYNREWVFRSIDLEVESGSTLAITGHNGSGKSTLLKIISQYMDPTEGRILYWKEGASIASEDIVPTINYCAPYVNLIEELTLAEHLAFHYRFKQTKFSLKEIAERCHLDNAWNKLVGEFSSGMKQRLKLAFSLYSEASLILLDEPTSNMDQQGIDWYLSEVTQISTPAPIIIASNQRYEYNFVNKEFNLTPNSSLLKKSVG